MCLSLGWRASGLPNTTTTQKYKWGLTHFWSLVDPLLSNHHPKNFAFCLFWSGFWNLGGRMRKQATKRGSSAWWSAWKFSSKSVLESWKPKFGIRIKTAQIYTYSCATACLCVWNLLDLKRKRNQGEPGFHGSSQHECNDTVAKCILLITLKESFGQDSAKVRFVSENRQSQRIQTAESACTEWRTLRSCTNVARPALQVNTFPED